MSLRLVKPGLLAVLPVHPTKTDPRTGMPLVALGVGRRGPIWPAMGGAESDEDEDENEDEGGDDNSDEGKGDDVEGLKARIKALEEEKGRHYKRRTDAEKELDELRKFKEKADNAGKSEVERLQAELTKTQAALEQAKDNHNKLKIENAFLTHNDIKWHKPGEALKLADLSQVEVDADGNVDAKALKAALTNLANSSKHLVKSASDDGDDAGSGSDQGSGSPMNGRRKGTKKEEEKPATREQLAQRFPALNAVR